MIKLSTKGGSAGSPLPKLAPDLDRLNRISAVSVEDFNVSLTPTLTNVFSATGKYLLEYLSLPAIGSSNVTRDYSARITIDGEVIFDSSFTLPISQTSFYLVGYKNGDGVGTGFLIEQSLDIELASPTETSGRISIGLRPIK